MTEREKLISQNAATLIAGQLARGSQDVDPAWAMKLAAELLPEPPSALSLGGDGWEPTEEDIKLEFEEAKEHFLAAGGSEDKNNTLLNNWRGAGRLWRIRHAELREKLRMLVFDLPIEEKISAVIVGNRILDAIGDTSPPGRPPSNPEE